MLVGAGSGLAQEHEPIRLTFIAREALDADTISSIYSESNDSKTVKELREELAARHERATGNARIEIRPDGSVVGEKEEEKP